MKIVRSTRCSHDGDERKTRGKVVFLGLFGFLFSFLQFISAHLPFKRYPHSQVEVPIEKWAQRVCQIYILELHHPDLDLAIEFPRPGWVDFRGE